MSDDEYKIVTEYPVTKYRCGLKAGDRVQLKRRIVVRNHHGKPTGEVHGKGEIWIVLRGKKGVVWLQQPDGTSHTWDDNQAIFDIFELHSDG